MKKITIEKGFGLLAVIFIIAIASILVLGAALALNLRSKTTVQQLEATKMLHLANSAVDIAGALAMAGGCGNVTPQITLEGKSFSILCSSYPVDEGYDPYLVFEIKAFSVSGNFNDGNMVSREVKATFTDKI